MAVDWQDGESREVHADLAQARVAGVELRLDFAERVTGKDGTVRAQPIAQLKISPETARQILAIVKQLLSDLENGRR